ncbi:hypothetical protein F2981_32775 (plasmid) [Sinorhizobium meliloti]|nr:hypothetical protein [Sinorhizobium meliloti]
MRSRRPRRWTERICRLALQSDQARRSERTKSKEAQKAWEEANRIKDADLIGEVYKNPKTCRSISKSRRSPQPIACCNSNAGCDKAKPRRRRRRRTPPRIHRVHQRGEMGKPPSQAREMADGQKASASLPGTRRS